MPVDVEQFLTIVRPALEAGDPAGLAEQVEARWSPRQLCKLLGHPETDVRQVTAVTLGLVGDSSCVGCLSRALHDQDATVNEMAEHGLWAIWFRSGKPAAAETFSQGVSLLCEEQYSSAMQRFEEAIRLDPEFAEAYNQCALAHFFLGQWDESIHDSRRALELMPAHFGAMAGMGHSYTHLGDLEAALRCYRSAIRINPRMQAIHEAIERLEIKLDDQQGTASVFQPSQLRR